MQPRFPCIAVTGLLVFLPMYLRSALIDGLPVLQLKNLWQLFHIRPWYLGQPYYCFLFVILLFVCFWGRVSLSACVLRLKVCYLPGSALDSLKARFWVMVTHIWLRTNYFLMGELFSCLSQNICVYLEKQGQWMTKRDDPGTDWLLSTQPLLMFPSWESARM